jgi:hypothetical protein
LPTSEKDDNVIAKRPEREFSLGAATVEISAKNRSGRSGSEPAMTAVGWLPEIAQESLPNGRFFSSSTGRNQHGAVLKGWLIIEQDLLF